MNAVLFQCGIVQIKRDVLLTSGAFNGPTEWYKVLREATRFMSHYNSLLEQLIALIKTIDVGHSFSKDVIAKFKRPLHAMLCKIYSAVSIKQVPQCIN